MLGVGWVDTDKTDETHRPRLVVQVIKTHDTPELFAATPPIEPLKYFLGRAAQGMSMNIVSVDVARAYLYDEASRDIYVKRPVENQREGWSRMCGKLIQAMCGTRDAPQTWQGKCSEMVRELGCVMGKVSPCHF